MHEALAAACAGACVGVIMPRDWTFAGIARLVIACALAGLAVDFGMSA